MVHTFSKQDIMEMGDAKNEDLKRKLDEIIRTNKDRKKTLAKILKELEEKRKVNNL